MAGDAAWRGAGAYFFEEEGERWLVRKVIGYRLRFRQSVAPHIIHSGAQGLILMFAFLAFEATYRTPMKGDSPPEVLGGLPRYPSTYPNRPDRFIEP